MNKKFILIIAILVILGGAGVYLAINWEESSLSQRVTNFEECAKAGYPVGESHPRQCWTPDGRHFGEKLTIEAAKELLSQSFLDKLGVVGVGIGECNGEPCIKVMLEKELKDVVIPSEFHGFKVETEITGLVCTQEAKICPDGSAVGRNPARNCEFDPCPKSGEKIIRKVGEQEGSFLIQKINTDSVDGLWYQAYPVPQGVGSPKTIRVGDDIGYACEGVSEKLTSIDFTGQRVTFTKIVSDSPLGGCPICLAQDTLIDTPSGPVSVQDLQVGMLVWTTDRDGQRVAGSVLKTAKVHVSTTHQMVHLVLDDGRDLLVSTGHPTTDGRTVGNLKPGDLYDAAYVVNTERVPYEEDATYDILPSGNTGFYWANGILVGSTLR